MTHNNDHLLDNLTECESMVFFISNWILTKKNSSTFYKKRGAMDLKKVMPYVRRKSER